MINYRFNKIRRRVIKFGALAMGSLPSIVAGNQQIYNKSYACLPVGGFFKKVDDIEVYCEIAGKGPLLIMQAGVWPTSSISDPDRRRLVAPLAKKFTVLAFDARGCGKTTLGRGPISYGRIAADTVRLMDVLELPTANFIGHSDGGCIQLSLLLHFSERIKTATLLGTAYSHHAYSDALQSSLHIWYEDMLNAKPNFVDLKGKAYLEESWSELFQKYSSLSPHPEKFSEVMRQQRRCWATEPNISIRQLSSIDRPVLVINAGKDAYIPTASMLMLAKAIPNSALVDFPELTHDITPYMEEISSATASFVDQNN